MGEDDGGLRLMVVRQNHPGRLHFPVLSDLSERLMEHRNAKTCRGCQKKLILLELSLEL